MWFKLASATFTNHLGKMSDLSNTVKVNISASGFTVSGAALTFSKNDPSGTSKTYTLTLQTGWEITSTPSIKTYSGPISAPTITGGTNGVYTLTVVLNAQPTQGIAIEIDGASYVGTGTPDAPTPDPETPVNPTPGGNNYIDITTQGTIKGSIKDSVINQSDSSSLYLLTKVQLPANAVSVEYQAFKTGGSYGSAFADNSNTVVKFLPKTNITTGERVTETVPSGATYFWHMWDDPNEATQKADAFTYIRVYTSGESGGDNPGGGESGGGGGSAEGLPVRITVQTQDNNKMLDVSTGQTTPIGDDGTGAQTITVCNIPSGATTVNYQMFKTGKNYGSGFFNGSTFISGHANNTEPAGTRKTLTIPSGATAFWHMYPNRVYAQGQGQPEFDYIEFA